MPGPEEDAAEDPAGPTPPFPIPWDKNPVEVGYCREVFDKYKMSEGLSEGCLRREGFETLIKLLMGAAAAARKKRELRTVAWFTHKSERDDADFVAFLKMLTGSGVSVKMLASGYEDALDPSRVGPVLVQCPHCAKDLPPDFKREVRKIGEDDEEEDENAQLLKKLGDIEKKRESLAAEAARRGQEYEENQGRGRRQHSFSGATSPGSPRTDPRICRLRLTELRAVAAALEKLDALGYSEIDVRSLQSGVAEAVKKRESGKVGIVDDLAATAPGGAVVALTSEEVEEAHAGTYTGGQIEPLSDGDKPEASGHRGSGFVNPFAGDGSGRARSAEGSRRRVSVGVDPRAQSPPSGARRGSQKLDGSRRGSARGSVGAGPSPPGPRRGSAAQRPSSRGSLHSVASAGSWFAKQDAGPPAPEPVPAPVPVPPGCTVKEDLDAARVRRTEKVVEAVRRGDVKGARQWVGDSELAIFVDGRTTLPLLAVELRKPGALDMLRLVTTAATVNARGELGEAPAHLAARLVMPEKVRGLAELGADLALPDLRGRSPLHLAAMHPSGVPTVKALLACGAPVAAVTDPGGASALHVACCPDVVAALLDGGADPAAPDAGGDTAAAAVVRGGVFDEQPEHAALRRMARDDVFAVRNAEKDALLHIAVAHGLARIVDTLAQAGGDAEMGNAKLLSPLDLARQTWQQWAATAEQVEWSAVLVVLGDTAESIATKGWSWHHSDRETDFKWQPVVAQEAAQDVAAARAEMGQEALEWEAGADAKDAGWAASAAEIFPHPDGAKWTRVEVDYPRAGRGTPGDRILFAFACGEGAAAEVSRHELRRLPNSSVDF